MSTTLAVPFTDLYSFGFWTINGLRQPDATGRSLPRVTLTIASTTTAVAVYFPFTSDLDGDGIPDWFEWNFHGTTNVTAATDIDSDGWSLATEFQRDTHPGMVDTLVTGGISARPAGSLWLVLTNTHTLFQISSSPPGIHQSSTGLAINSTFTLAGAADSTNGYWFTGWYLDGVRVADELNRAADLRSVSVTSNNTAIAHYLHDSLDADGDGVPDWFEWRFYGHTGHPATADTDGDGFTLDDEFRRDQHPNLIDTIPGGGVSHRTATSIFYTYNDPDYLVYLQNSDPPGFINTGEILPTGTARRLPDLSAIVSIWRFAQWETNAVRVADELGRSLGGIPLSLTTNTTAVARFILDTEDTDSDGLPDWYEYQFFGNTAEPATADHDVDGLNLAEEFRRDTHPRVPDTFVSGGFSRRASVPITVGFATYEITSSPTGLVAAAGVVPLGTLIETLDLATGKPGYGFSHWTVDGIRQNDSTGAALTQIYFSVLANTVVIAHFFPVAQDTDDDGLPDWWESRYFGTITTTTPTTDDDGDGHSNTHEFIAGTHPRNPNSVLRITAFGLEAEGFALQFPTVTNRLYHVQYANTLGGANDWHSLTNNLPGTGNTLEVLDLSAPTQPRRFYRVRVTSP